MNKEAHRHRLRTSMVTYPFFYKFISLVSMASRRNLGVHRLTNGQCCSRTIYLPQCKIYKCCPDCITHGTSRWRGCPHRWRCHQSCFRRTTTYTTNFASKSPMRGHDFLLVDLGSTDVQEEQRGSPRSCTETRTNNT